MKVNNFGKTANFIAEMAIENHIPFTEAIELVIRNANKSRELDSSDNHLKEDETRGD